MKIRYSREVDILTLELDQEAPITHAEQSGDTIVHMNDEQPVLIEILHARSFVSALVDAVMQPDALEIE